MIIGFLSAVAVTALLLLIVIYTGIFTGTLKTVLAVLLGIFLFLLIIANAFFINLYCTFSYDGKKQFASRIIEHVSDYVKLPENGVGLDVGCDSAAPTIACAKKNPKATMVGLDRWGKE